MTTIAATTTATTATAASGTSTLSQLAGNFNDFLKLLTTQLQNQDPTAPMDTSQFTSQLVQFTSVQEQIDSNATLTQLLASTVGQQLSQASSLVGDKVAFTGGVLPLQSSSATVNFQTPGAESVQVVVSDSNGTVVQTATVNAVSGANQWTWDGLNSAGKQLADGAYAVTVTASGVAVPFQSVGNVTGAQQVNQAVQLLFGTASVPFSSVTTLSAGTGTATGG